MSKGTQIKLGGHSYEIVAQPIGWLEQELGDKLNSLGTSDLDGNIIGSLGSQAHSILKVFIPELMPEYEWRGYASREAFDAGEYDRVADRSPSANQIAEAFDVALKANGDLGAKVGNVLGPELLRALIRQAISGQLSGQRPSLPPTNGTSPSVSSGTAVPTQPTA